MNGLNKMICEIVRLRNETDKEIQEYCPRSESSESSSSSSHIDCPLECETVGPEWMSQINVNDLDQAAYDLLAQAESEACAAYRKIKLFSKEEGCAPITSSSESSSSSEEVAIGCGDLVQNTELHPYKEFTVNITSGEGWVYFSYNTYGVPKKFVVEYNSVEVINTGYVGDSIYNLDLFLETGEYVSGPPSGLESFEKTITLSQATVKVYSPLLNGELSFTVECPIASSSSSESSSESSVSSSSTVICEGFPIDVIIVSMCPEIPESYNMTLIPWAQIDYSSCAYIEVPATPSSSSSTSLSSRESSLSSSESISVSESSSLPESSSSSLSSSSSGDTFPDPSSSADPYEGLLKLLYNEISSSWEIHHQTLSVIATKLGDDPVGVYIFEAGPCAGEVIYIIPV